jgi:3-hydroxyisobutyrate dehydrogenase-like beta-hydroxyacid dehydrogenase
LKLGLLGPGQIGRGIARNLLAAGHELIVWGRTPSRAQELADAGASVASSAAEAVKGREVVITVMADDAALEAVVPAILDTLDHGAIHLLMGTHSVAAVETLTKQHAERGQAIVAAPVVGRPQVAASGELLLLVAGDPNSIGKCAPLFEAVGRGTISAGLEPVSAAALKLTNNFALAVAIEAMAEAFSFARAYGLHPEVVQELFTTGMFKGSSVYAGYGQRMVDGTYEPAGMRTELALKDIDLIRDAAGARGVPMPSANVCRDTLRTAIEDGDGSLDWAVVARSRARAAGLE